MNEVWKTTPIDIVDKIMRYTGKMRWRNGVFMNQIRKDDVRYIILQTIPQKTYTFDPIENIHITTILFTSCKNDVSTTLASPTPTSSPSATVLRTSTLGSNMNKIVVKYEYPYIWHILFKHSVVDGFHACFDEIIHPW